MLKFIKKYWLLILISLGSLVFIAGKLVETKPPVVVPTPSTSRVADYKSLLPGISTEDEVNKLLGSPIKEITEGTNDVAEYKSSNKYRNDIVVYDNEKVSLIKEVVNTQDNKNSDYITNEFGLAPYILYAKYPSASFNLYVYPQNGIAYLGHEDKTLLEIWYFEPTTIDEFIKLWGSDYSKEKPQNLIEGY